MIRNPRKQPLPRDPTTGMTSKDEERLLARIQKGSPKDCWPWTGCAQPSGHGQIVIGGKVKKVHRLAWTLAKGPIPPGLQVLHKCDNPPCCNPDHLFLGTNADNTKDAAAKGRRPQGEAHYRAKLNAATVRMIRAVHAETGWRSKRIITHLQLSIGYSTVDAILDGKTWKRVT